jgi:hypothetical protein
MHAQNDFPIVFEQLKNIFKPYAQNLSVKTDTADAYYLSRCSEFLSYLDDANQLVFGHFSIIEYDIIFGHLLR